MKPILFCVAAAVVLFSTPFSSRADDTVIDRAIDDANARLIELQKNGDAAGLGRMYTEDAVLLPAGRKKLVGPEDIESFWAEALRAGVMDVQLTTENLVPLADDLVYEIGSYLTTPADAAPISGYYLVLWKRVEGDWKLHVDIFNEDRRSQ